MPTALSDAYFKVIGRTLIENDTMFRYQLQQVPNPDVPNPNPNGPMPGIDMGAGTIDITSPKETPILEETIIKLTRAWEVYRNA